MRLSLKGDVMRKVRESTLAEIQRVPVLHDGLSVPAVAAVAFCAGGRSWQTADRGRQGSATASGRGGKSGGLQN